MKTLAIILIALIQGANLGAQDICVNPDYSLESGYLKIKYKRSIFYLNDKKGNGSAFVVDAAQGLLITAKHVITDSLTAYVSNPFVNRDFKFKVRILHEDAQKDLCLIRIIDLKTFSKFSQYINDFDVAFNNPTNGHTFYSLSYPDKKSIDPTLIATKIVRSIEKDNLVEMQMPGRPGMSGSPLIDQHGYVVGFAKAAHFDATTTFIRLFTLSDVIYEKLGTSAKSRSFLLTLQKGPVDVDELLFVLDNDPFRIKVKNVEIINLLKGSNLEGKLTYDTALVKYLDCIRGTLAARGLAKLIPAISKLYGEELTVSDLLKFSSKLGQNRSAAFGFLELAEARTQDQLAERLNVDQTALTTMLQADDKTLEDRIGSNVQVLLKTSTAQMLNDLSYINYLKGTYNESSLSQAVKFSKLALKVTADFTSNYYSETLLREFYLKLGDEKNAKKSEKRLEDARVRQQEHPRTPDYWAMPNKKAMPEKKDLVG